MSNIFNLQINDYAFAGIHACRIDKDIFNEHLLNINPKEQLTPIPFSYKVLEGFLCSHSFGRGCRTLFFPNFSVKIYKDKSTKFLYVIDDGIRTEFRHLHDFQRYLRSKHNYELPFEGFGYNLEDHINSLNIVRDYIEIDGHIFLNESAFKTRSHFGYESP